MNIPLFVVGLLAQFSRWQRMGDRFRRSGPRVELTDLAPVAIVLAVVVVAIVVGVRIYRRNDFSSPCDDPQKMFRQLCAAHKLDLSSRRLLMKLAGALEMPHPAALFVTPSAFRASDLPLQLQADEARLTELARRLF